MASRTATILVTGDMVVDWCFVDAHAQEDEILDITWFVSSGNEVFAAAMPSGAGRAAQIMKTAVAALPDGGPAIDVIGPELPSEVLHSPLDGRVNRSFSLVTRFPSSLGDRTRQAWRMGRIWGLHQADAPQTFLPDLGDRSVDVLAIQDVGLGYRGAPETWYPGERPLPREIVLSTMAPFAGNALLDDLLRRAADRLTIVVPVMELRKTGSQIGYPLSWERTAEEVDAAVRAHLIGRAARVVVQLELSGAVVVSHDGPTTLVFDPSAAEGSFLRMHPGTMLGYQLCYVAALAPALAAGGKLDALEAVRRGVAASRGLHREGLAVVEEGGRPRLHYPAEAVARALNEEPAEIIATFHPRADGERSIISGTLGGVSPVETAEQLALNGPASLPAGIPVETVGNWSSVDRIEIEKLRSVGLVIDEYVTRFRGGERVGRPLSVAVFGPPGSGKSFAVKETIGQKVVGGVKTLEFNLSQFDGAAELPPAFHQVRDAVLEERLPLVFWDEFDTPLGGRSLGWLRHFLAPMQDGRFREGGAFHPLGPAIFVFAGGTAASFAEFAAGQEDEAAKAAKKPDFVSRLRGYVDVLGPNRTAPDDDAVILRRALLLRSLLLRKAPQIAAGRGPAAVLRLDPGLLRGFLLIADYKHGARSMEALIDMSSLSGKPRYEQSSLPAPHLLELHVDAREFLELVEG